MFLTVCFQDCNFYVTTHTSKQELVRSTVTARNLGQIGLKRGGATEAYDQYAAGSDNEADARNGLKCEQLHFYLEITTSIVLGET